MGILSNLNGETIVEIIFALGIIAVLYIFSPLFSYGIIKIFNMKSKGSNIKNNPLYIPIRIFIRLFGIYLAIRHLRPVFGWDEQVMLWVTKIFRIVVILSISTGLAHSISEKSLFIKKFKEKTNRDVDDSSIIFMIRTIRFLIYLIAGFMIIYDLGYNLSGLVTGLGIGSVVLTFALQDAIKNLFGGLVIFLDKPFKVGDYISVSGYEGTVEDITFRSTKIRTLEHSIAQIPNGEIASTTVVNASKIRRRRYNLDLGLVLDTDLKKMKKLEEQILNFLNNDEIVIKDTANVSFREVRSSDYNIYVYCYLKVADYADFLKEKERLNYTIMEILQKDGIEMAYNTQTIEIKK